LFGYSLLNSIARLPIDTLKIDQSFIKDRATSKNHKAIVSTIISVAHSLKLKMRLKVSKRKSSSMCLSIPGCDQIQGFLCSRTLPPEQIEPGFALPAA
jgi:EAL domain-containing protein (putative c-di-GMP-specific phosphodiesterase class I)